MHCYLLELPVELMLQIVEELRRYEDEYIEAHLDVAYNDQEEMPDGPVRIYHNLINWSCTCSYFRNLLAPDVFKTVKLANDEKSGFSLNAVAKSQHKVHVKELYFTGFASVDFINENAAFSNVGGILPRSVDEILGDLKRFQNLKRLSIKFDYGCKKEVQWTVDDMSLDLFPAQEFSEQVLEAEASKAWRILMLRIYSALVRNESPHFKHFEIRQLIWKNVPIFDEPVFHHFLGHFEQFTLSVHGEQCGAGWDSMSYDAGWDSVRIEESLGRTGGLDKCVLNHLVNVTTLSIQASEGPLTWEGHAPLTLKADQMPLLTTLHLFDVMVCEELADFLVGHKNTLETVTMCDCYANAHYIGSWSQLFYSLFSACPARLRRFELAFFCDEWMIRFPYVLEDDEYGTLSYDAETSEAASRMGEDQGWWDLLMGLVGKNVKDSAKIESRGVELQAQS